MRRCALLALALAGVLLAAAAPASARTMPGCADPDVPGGEWRSYGGDLANTRTQPRERTITPADAALLTPAFTFSTAEHGIEGDFTGNPIVADGCIYAATNRGWAMAINADDGKLVWKTKFPQGGTANNSVAVSDRACGKSVKYRKKVVKRRVNGKIKRTVKRVRVAKTKYCPTVFVAATRTRGSLSGDADVDEVEGCPHKSCTGPYAFALDQANGKVAWLTAPLDEQTGADLYGSPVIFDGVLMLGVSGGAAELGDEADRIAFQGSMSFIDAGTGRILEKTWTIHPPKQPDDDYAGAGIWSTPAVDAEGKAAYVGTANPFKPQAEHKHSNAVVKFDVNRKSKRFGEIVGSYKGTIDEYVPGLSELPCYDFPNNNPPYYPQGLGACGDIDLDFGASPNVFRGPDGRKLVGAGQKSGVYHAFEADSMKPAWTQVVGPPGAFGGIIGSTAYDGNSIYGPITIGGYAWSIDAAAGSHRWVSPIADAFHWGPPVSAANGVVYSLDTTGFLNAYDARTGVLLAKKHLSSGGTKDPSASMSWGGVSIARNTVYANTGLSSLSEGYIVAYRPGAPQDAPEDLVEGIGGGGGGGGGEGGGQAAAGGAIVAVPGSTYSTYATPVMVTQPGGPLNFMNMDLPQHDVIADDKGPDGRPLFQSKLSGIGEIAPIEGLDRVKSGQTYGFFCSLHPGMRGSLIVR
jgi:polyvinyl alcohol dehydrogenase (cytochrome)